MINKRQRISQIIKQLEKIRVEHGDLFVYYASDYDWCLPIYYVSIEEDSNWDNAPKGKACYLN